MSHATLGLYIYAVILLLGGIMGYVKAKSTPSLIAGIISAIIAAAAGSIYPNHPRESVAIGGILALVLTIVFFRRFQTTRKPMPAIPMTVISALVLIASGYELIKIHHGGQ